MGGGAGSNGGLGSCAGFLSVCFWGESVDSGTSKACGLSSDAGRLASSNSSVGAEGFLASRKMSKINEVNNDRPGDNARNIQKN